MSIKSATHPVTLCFFLGFLMLSSTSFLSLAEDDEVIEVDPDGVAVMVR